MHLLHFQRVSVSVCLLVMGASFPGGSVSAQPPARKNLVVTSRVVRQSFTEEQSFVGSVEAIRQSMIGSAVAGRVGAVHFERGDGVTGPAATTESTLEARKGQVLIELETQTLLIEIDSARIQLELAQQVDAELQLALPIDIRQAETRVADAKSRLEYSENEFKRMDQIDQRANAISRTELEQARNQFQGDQQLLAIANVELERLKTTRELKLLQSTRRVDAAQQEVIRLQDLKSKYTIRAPFKGFVVSKMTEVGAWIAVGDPVAEIVELEQVDFAFNVPQEFIGKIQEAMAASNDRRNVGILIDGFDDELQGKLLSVVPRVDLRSRLVTVQARVGNPVVGGIPLLKPGMLGRANLAVGKTREMTVLSRDALVLGGPQPLVYKLAGVGADPVVVAVPVRLGSSVGSLIEVFGEVREGDEVVVEGNEQLQPGMTVTVTKKRDEPGNG